MDPANICFSLPLTLLMVMGLRRVYSSNREIALLFVSVLFIFPSIYYFSHSDIRYRQLIDPEILILTVCALLKESEVK